MVLHEYESHKSSNTFVKIGAVLKREDRDNPKPIPTAFRPREHAFNSSTGNHYFGSDAHGWRIDCPSSALNSSNDHKVLTCRKCKNYNIEFPDELTYKTKCKRISTFSSHESKCK